MFYENCEAVKLFWHCLTQFRHGFSGPTGLDYSGVKCVAESLNIDFNAELASINVMENEYLKIVSEQQSKDKK